MKLLFLLAKGEDPDSKNRFGLSVLNMTAYQEKHLFSFMLLEHGASPHLIGAQIESLSLLY